MAYTALAKGYFTKKATGQSMPAQTARWYSNMSNERIYAELTRKAHSLHCSVSELELAFLMHQSFATVPIVSFSNQQQLEQGIKSCDLVLDHETVEKLNNMKSTSIKEPARKVCLLFRNTYKHVIMAELCGSQAMKSSVL